MASTLVEYPKVLPVDAAKLFLARIRGEEVGYPELVHGGWNILGYGLHLGLPVATPIGASSEGDSQPELADEDAFVYVLDNAQTPGTVAQAGPLATIALKIVLSYVWKYLQNNIDKLLPLS